MKKILISVVCIVLVFSLTACGNNERQKQQRVNNRHGYNTKRLIIQLRFKLQKRLVEIKRRYRPNGIVFSIFNPHKIQKRKAEHCDRTDEIEKSHPFRFTLRLLDPLRHFSLTGRRLVLVLFCHSFPPKIYMILFIFYFVIVADSIYTRNFDRPRTLDCARRIAYRFYQTKARGRFLQPIDSMPQKSR